VQVIRHVVYGDQLLVLTGDNAGDVLLKFVVVFWRNKVLPPSDREHDMEIDLRVGVCHEPKMPLLTELENLFLFWFYKDFTPTALSGTSPIPENTTGRNVRDGLRQHCILRAFWLAVWEQQAQQALK
jgi:hypothetical protein